MSKLAMADHMMTLHNNNIPFEFDGMDLNIKIEHAPLLMIKNIPFEFKDGKIKLKQTPNMAPTNVPKKEITIDDLMETIKNLLIKKIKASFFLYGDKKEEQNKSKINIRLEYPSDSFFAKSCDIQLYNNKLTLTYENRNATIHFSDSFENLNHLMPQYIDGFILMIIAGFTYEITPISWNWFYLPMQKEPSIIYIKYWDMFYFDKNKIPYLQTSSMYEAMKELETFTK